MVLIFELSPLLVQHSDRGVRAFSLHLNSQRFALILAGLG
jgi:hypothetical protein